MSAYTTQSAILTRISAPDLNSALDDDGDGQPDSGLLDNIIASIGLDIDGRLASIYTVPFGSPPPTVQAAALVMACEAIYKRRLTPEEKNIFTPEAKLWRDRLTMIGNNELDLDASLTRSFPPVIGFVECLSMDCNTR